MEATGLTSNYQDCRVIYEMAYNAIFSSGYAQSLWMVVKSLAIGAVLMKWYKDFYKPILEPGGAKIIPEKPNIWSIMIGVAYILCIAGASQLIYGMEYLLGQLEAWATSRMALPESTFDLYEQDPLIPSTGSMVLDAIYTAAKAIIMAFVIVIDYMYFLGRVMGLLLFQIVFPLSLTLGIFNDEFMQNLIKQLKIFAAIFLSGIGFLIAIYISNVAFFYLNTGTLQTIPFVILLIVLFAKKAMFGVVNNTLSRIFG